MSSQTKITLSEEIYIGVSGTVPGDARYRDCHITAHGNGITLSFNEVARQEHLCIYLKPEDAARIGNALLKEADNAYGIAVMNRFKLANIPK